jgi:hypothetical protein
MLFVKQINGAGDVLAFSAAVVAVSMLLLAFHAVLGTDLAGNPRERR